MRIYRIFLPKPKGFQNTIWVFVSMFLYLNRISIEEVLILTQAKSLFNPNFCEIPYYLLFESNSD